MGMQLIETIEVGAGGAASIEFTGIPQDGVDLVLVLSLRSDITSPRGIRATIANDTGANYSWIRLEGDSGVVGSLSGTGVAYLYLGNDNSSDSTANTFGNTSAYISNYTSTSGMSVSSDTVSEDNASGGDEEQGIYASSYSGANACTSLQLYPSSGNWVQYSTASLYKITAD